MSGITRRGFIGLAAAVGAGAGIGTPLLAGLRGSASTGVLLPSLRPVPARFTVPLTLPPVLKPGHADETGDHYRLTARPARAEILPGVLTTIWGYGGIFPGPTIESRSGRPVRITHVNRLPVPMVVHLHGGRTPQASDGYPTDLILPAGPATRGMPGTGAVMPGAMPDPMARIVYGSKTYVYPLAQRAMPLWYHDHRMDFTGASVWRGLAGFHIIRDEEEDALGLPSGPRELPLMITDRSFRADGQFRYPSIDPALTRPGVSGQYASGVLGDVILVNGRPWPYKDVDRAAFRLRILNASNARRYRLSLDPAPPDGTGMTQIGSDGGLLAKPVSQQAIEVAPAERFDVVIDFSSYQAGQKVTLRNEFGDGAASAVMQFRVGDTVPRPWRAPARLSAIAALREHEANITRTLLFQNAGGEMGWTINHQAYRPDRANVTAASGTVEKWDLITDFHHPVHLHLVHFQVLSRGLGGPGSYDSGWKDVIDLRPAERATIITRFPAGITGRYVFHCHNLEHEDMGMMANLMIT